MAANNTTMGNIYSGDMANEVMGSEGPDSVHFRVLKNAYTQGGNDTVNVTVLLSGDLSTGAGDDKINVHQIDGDGSIDAGAGRNDQVTIGATLAKRVTDIDRRPVTLGGGGTVDAIRQSVEVNTRNGVANTVNVKDMESVEVEVDPYDSVRATGVDRVRVRSGFTKDYWAAKGIHHTVPIDITDAKGGVLVSLHHSDIDANITLRGVTGTMNISLSKQDNLGWHESTWIPGMPDPTGHHQTITLDDSFVLSQSDDGSAVKPRRIHMGAEGGKHVLNIKHGAAKHFLRPDQSPSLQQTTPDNEIGTIYLLRDQNNQQIILDKSTQKVVFEGVGKDGQDVMYDLTLPNLKAQTVPHK